MARTSPLLSNFNGGEISRRALGRVDLAVFRTACKELVNFLTSVIGFVTKRPGTVYAGATKTGAQRSWLAGFLYPDARGYVMEWGDQYIRFWTEHGQIVGPLELPTAITVGDLTDDDGVLRLQFAQSNDVVYAVHPDYNMIKVARTSPSVFTLLAHGPTVNEWGQIPLDQRAFEDVGIDQTRTIYASASGPAGASITLTATGGYIFQPSDSGFALFLEDRYASAIPAWEPAKAVGASSYRRVDNRTYFTAAGGTTGTIRPTHTEGSKLDGDVGVLWVYNDPGYGVVLIDGAGLPSATATALVISPLPPNIVGVGNGTFRFAWQSFRSNAGYPSAVAFWRERLWYMKGNRVYASVLGDFDNFERRRAGVIEADSAMQLVLPQQGLWLCPTEKALLVGSVDGGVTLITEQTTTEIFGPLNYRIGPASKLRAGAPQPVVGGESALYASATRSKLLDAAYAIDRDGYLALDRTKLADDILEAGVIQLAFQEHPDPMLWVLLADGTLAQLAYNKDEGVFGWARHEIAGGFVESIAISTTPDRLSEEVWLQVRRVIGGVTRRYVEYMEQRFKGADGIESAHFVDSGLRYSGVPVTSVTGLSHLEGQTVDILVDGKVQPPQVVVAGAVEVPEGSEIAVGLGYVASLETTPIDVGGPEGGTAFGKNIATPHVWLMFDETVGGWVGCGGREMQEIFFQTTEDLMDQATPLFTGLKRVAIDGGSDPSVTIRYEQRQPLPATLLGFAPSITTKGSG